MSSSYMKEAGGAGSSTTSQWWTQERRVYQVAGAELSHVQLCTCQQTVRAGQSHTATHGSFSEQYTVLRVSVPCGLGTGHSHPQVTASGSPDAPVPRQVCSAGLWARESASLAVLVDAIAPGPTLQPQLVQGST